MTIDKVRKQAIGRHLYINGEDVGTVKNIASNYGYEILISKGDGTRKVQLPYCSQQMEKLCAGNKVHRQRRTSYDGNLDVYELKGEKEKWL